MYLQGPVAYDNALKHGVNNIVILADIAMIHVPFVSYHFQVSPASLNANLELHPPLECHSQR